MVFNEVHKQHPGFKAIKWMIEKSKVVTDRDVSDADFPNNRELVKEFKGRLPHRMIHDLEELGKLGYKLNTIDFGIGVQWIAHKGSRSKEHYITIQFGKYVSNGNKATMYYRTYEYDKV